MAGFECVVHPLRGVQDKLNCQNKSETSLHCSGERQLGPFVIAHDLPLCRNTLVAVIVQGHNISLMLRFVLVFYFLQMWKGRDET